MNEPRVRRTCQRALKSTPPRVILRRIFHARQEDFHGLADFRSVHGDLKLCVFGVQWKDDMGTRNAHCAPFPWSG